MMPGLTPETTLKNDCDIFAQAWFYALSFPQHSKISVYYRKSFCNRQRCIFYVFFSFTILIRHFWHIMCYLYCNWKMYSRSAKEMRSPCCSFSMPSPPSLFPFMYVPFVESRSIRKYSSSLLRTFAWTRLITSLSIQTSACRPSFPIRVSSRYSRILTYSSGFRLTRTAILVFWL